MTLWVHRLPETLHEEDKQPIRVGVIARNMRSAVTLRSTIGYTLASALVFGGLFGFINSSQQLIGEAFGAGDMFPLLFAICAGCMALANWSNSRIVERHGARRVSHTALFLFIIVAALQLWFANQPDESLWTFVPLMAANMSLLGFIGANFGLIAMRLPPYRWRRIERAELHAHDHGRAAGRGGYAGDGTARPWHSRCWSLRRLASPLCFIGAGPLFGPPEPDIETD